MIMQYMQGEWNNKLVCKGICVRHKAMKPVANGRYSTGQKRCQICEIFLTWDGLWCPCCGYRLRTRPRNSKFKAEVRSSIEKIKLNQLAYTSSHISKLNKNILHTNGGFFIRDKQFGSLVGITKVPDHVKLCFYTTWASYASKDDKQHLDTLKHY
jgi:hypothetical protein